MYNSEEKYAGEAPHSLTIDGRRKLVVSGIADVESFNEQEIVMSSGKWGLTVRGDGLHMERLSVDSGDVTITGRIDGVEYEDGAPARTGLFSKLFR